MGKFRKIFKSMRGAFLPKEGKTALTKDIFDSIKELRYYGPEYDSINMHNDMKNIGNDMKKALDKTRIKFKPLAQ